MEEADEILLTTLGEAKCKVPRTLKSLEDIDARTMLRITSSALSIIDDIASSKDDQADTEEQEAPRKRKSTVGKSGKAEEADSGQYPEALPVNVAMRHRVCTTVAKRVKEIGYRGEFGYSQILYPSTKDVRRFFQWLVEVLPRKSQKSQSKDTSPAALLKREIADAVSGWMKQQWNPVQSKAKIRQKPTYIHQLSMPQNLDDAQNLSNDQKKYQTDYMLPLNQQVNDSSVLAHLLLSREDQEDIKPTGEETKSQTQLSRRAHAAISKEAMRKPPVEGGIRHLHGEDLDKLDQYFRGEHLADASLGIGGSNFQRSVHYSKEDIDVNPEVLAAARGEVSKSSGMLSSEQEQQGADEDGHAQNNTESQKQEKTQEEIEEETIQRLERELEQSQHKLGEIQQTISTVEDNINQLRQTVGSEQLRNVELENDYKIHVQAAKAMPEADAKIKELQQSCSDMANQIVDAAAQFEQKRRPLLEKLRQLKRSDAEKQEKASQLQKETDRLANEMRDMTKEMQGKEEVVSQLKKETETLDEEKSRVFYTQRILEMIGETHKQRAEILQVVNDIRKLQEETSKIEGRLGRTASIAENIIYKSVKENDSRNNPEYLEIYSQFSEIRECFRTLISLVQEGADNENEQRDYEAQVQQLQEKNIKENTDKVLQDLARIQEENKKLEQEKGQS